MPINTDHAGSLVPCTVNTVNTLVVFVTIVNKHGPDRCLAEAVCLLLAAVLA